MEHNLFQKSYIDYLTFEKGLSANSIKSYTHDLVQLVQLIEHDRFESVKIQDIRRASAKLNSQGLNGKSIARMLSAWRSFFDYLIERHQFKDNPVKDVHAPKNAKTLPQTLSIEQIIKLISIDDTTLLGLRDKAFLELFYSSGLRLSEVVNVNINDLDLHEGVITVTGKGNKTRIVPMGQHAIDAIKSWIEKRASIKIHETSADALFITERGKRMTPRAIQYRIQMWAIKQGIDSTVHPHLLRHSFASHVLQSSQDLRAVQEMLGHANISSTQVYTHLDFQHLANIYDKAHPRAKKKS
ncbi:MAG: tyrosine recombinase XerC [Candidatus Methylopumilus sp.]|nr:tyrosine recombinase XerC [Candidatus Methylopumilus sp.]